jgi:large subunit ribosomal protein L21
MRVSRGELGLNTRIKMFAVIKTGGKQYRVAAQDVITVATLAGEPGSSVTFDQVLMVTNDNGTQVGAPLVEGVTVTGEVMKHTRGEKVIAFKKRRRQNSRRKRGHRQDYTMVRITEILAAGEKPNKAAAGKTTKAAADDAAPAETAAE